MNFRQRRKVLKKISAMDLIPVNSRGFEMEEDKVVVLVPKFENKIYHLFSPRLARLFYRIKLDELGSESWLAIDGLRNVGEICDYLKQNNSKEDEKIDEIEERLSKYMTMLYERRFISFKQIMED